MIAPYRVVWLAQSSLDFDVRAEIAFDAEQGATSSFLNRESVTTEHYDGTYRRIHSYKYNEVFTPRITFVKQDYEEFTPEENRKILSWLTAKDSADWLEIYHDDSNVMSYKLLGNFVTVEQHKLGNDCVIGYECEFESSSPYAWSQKYEITKQIVNSGNLNITCNSDEYNKLLYPKVTVTFAGENIYLPADKDPKDLSYKMIPKVIYSYTYMDYNQKAIKDAFDNLSDDEKIDLGIVEKDFTQLSPEELDKIGTHAGLSKESITKLYININTGDEEDQGRFEILGSSASNVEAEGYVTGHYYFSKDQVVKKVVTTTNDDGSVSRAWKIVSTVGAAVKINNTTTSKETIIAGGTIGETIIFDGANKVVSSDKDTTVKIIGDDFNWVWPAFIADKNSFTVTGSCDIKFEWTEPRKVGNV